MPKVMHIIIVQTDDDSFGLDPKLAYEKRVSVLLAKEDITLEQVLDAVLKLTSADLSFTAIREPVVEPPVPLYKARVKSTGNVRDSTGHQVSIRQAGEVVSVYKDGLTVTNSSGISPTSYSERAVITMPGVEPELNVWSKNLEKIDG